MPSLKRKASKFEGTDYSLDVNQKAMGSMKIWDETMFGKDDIGDETYIAIVNDLLGIPNRKKERDKDDDPTYAFFLENLVEDSNSYVLSVSLDHGVFFPIKYEPKDDHYHYDKPKRQTPRSSSSSFLQESRTLGMNSDQESDMENFGSVKEDTLVHKRSSSSMGARLKSCPKRSPHNPLGESRADSVAEAAEPYKVLISGLKGKGNSIVYKGGDVKQVLFEESAQHKSSHVQNEPSKRVFRAQIPSPRPPVPTPTQKQATPTTKAPNPTSGLKVKGDAIVYKRRDGKQVLFEESAQHKSCDVQNELSKRVFRAQIPSPRPPVSAPTPRPATPTMKAPNPTSGLKVKGDTVVYKCRDRKQVIFEENNQHKSSYVQNKPSKQVPRAQIPSPRPPIPAPTPRLATATTKAPNPTAKLHDKVGNRSSVAAFATEISTKPPNQSATPTPAQTPRALPTSTSNSISRVSIGCSSRLNHTSNSRAPASSESAFVLVCGLGANREAVLQGYGDGKRVSYEESYKKRPTDVQNEPLETGSTLKLPTIRPPIRGPGSSEPNSIPKTPNPLNAPTPRPLAKKYHCAVLTEKAQTLNSRPPTPSPSQRAADPTPFPTPRAPTSSPTPVTKTSMQSDRCNMSGNLSETLKKNRNAAQRSLDLFSEELERICQQPYRQKDYKDLLEVATVRKPMLMHKETRCGAYVVPGEMGKSYLDTYPDLDEEIKKVKSDPKKALNLLRGLFFYLQHLPHVIPMPWKYDPWMKIMLGST